MTLIELMIAMSLMMVILAATLTTFSVMQRNSQRSENVNELQDATRTVIDQIAKRSRNLASRSDNVSHPIDRATADDFIFQVVGKGSTAPSANPTNITRYRYCLDSSKQVWEQTQILSNSATSAPSPTVCPANGGWSTRRVLGQSVVNGTRPVFTYLIAGPPPARFTQSTSVPDAQLDLVVGIRTELFVDDDPLDDPPESTLTTRVFLRNQNRKPTASFTSTSSTGMTMQLNGGDSEDPEGARLTFEWFDDALGTGTKIGEGSVYVYSTTTPGTHKIWLRVTDPAGNYAIAPVQTFTCSTTTGCV